MKIIGACIICACALLLGLYCSGRKAKRLKQCELMLSFMKYVRTEICDNKTPTKVICRRASEEYGLKNAGSAGIFESCRVIYDCVGQGELSDLKSFCERIGKGDAELQRGEFDFLISKTEQTAKSLREQLPKAKELTATLFLFFGVLFVILFI